MNQAGGYEEHVTGPHVMQTFAVDRKTRVTFRDYVEFIAVMRLLLIDGVRRVPANLERPVLNDDGVRFSFGR